jgi:hypothetical protein
MSDLKPFILFNEKFEELQSSGFVKNWVGKKINYNFDFEKDEVNQEIPNKDEIKSFILTLRFFIQDNESCSLRNLSNQYGDAELPGEIVSEFENIKAFLNKYLDSKTGFGPKDETQYSFRYIFESYIYGHHAHSNDQKRNEIKKWQESKFIGSHTNYFFIEILFKVYFLLKKVKIVNEKALKHLQAS